MKFSSVLNTATSAIAVGVAFLAVPAFAQSTGSVDFEEDAIVVTGLRAEDVAGLEIPATPKAKQVLTAEQIQRARPGQTINDIINLVPGVSFQNNDPWGSMGGGFTIRGFGADRVSQTLDGLPLNDSGNYALYTNQQVDTEILESVNVNLGVTDVDSPTASASGGTVNIRTRTPGDDFGLFTTMTIGDVLSPGSYSDSLYTRAFGMIDTGDFTGVGTKAFISASYQNYGVPYNPYGRVDKTQLNARLYQDLGSNGDFVSVAGHWNQNRNNFAGSENVNTLLGYYNDEFSKRDRFTVYTADGQFPYPCSLPEGTVYGGGGVNGQSERYSDSSSSGDCGAPFYRRYNPSDTGNIRGSSRFTLADGLILTVDPSYQYVKANGGGPDDLREGFFTVNGVNYTGAFNGGYYFGRDLNGDGDILDRVGGIDPSQTRTDRLGVIANMIWEINDDHRVRVAYTWDRARHRQTGQIAPMLANGEPTDVFAIDDALLDLNGEEVNKRDRLSWAILHQVSGEYRGTFGDFTAVLGLRAPFFTRRLTQNCYTTSISGFVDCPAPGQDMTAYEAANPDYARPQSRKYTYDKLLPNVGFTYNFLPTASVFANYAKGLSVPGTDPLYDSLYLPDGDFARPVPETTDSFDVGFRYREGRLTAQLAGWYTKYKDRLASAFDPNANNGEGATVYRNLGTVDKWGVDGSIAYQPTDNSLIYIFGSYNDSEIKDDILSDGGVVATAGNMESGSPNYSYGARGQIAFGALELGGQVKRTGKRWLDDANTQRVPSYTLVDLDARLVIGEGPTGGDVALQLNLTNLFDEYYVGYFGGSLNGESFAQIGAPRAGSLALSVGF
ncbi:TonB-dependent receptor [Novosphingobium sp. MBES04]|uniref:TonB-dependent receptor n=1 Tax=Novosphingobium sp. MBES04 TaxID=1206458 RepID=UPI0006942706|nr:TonB-dependent receptor [Novosphingobium sp. MBES04]GAM05724.1 TonB-dependent receptor-like protein [Novosphingobium sp. MBES04]